jgi:diguanylate cyclase (GGDEF)-like protein/PAS domain S-box-containing protein
MKGGRRAMETINEFNFTISYSELLDSLKTRIYGSFMSNRSKQAKEALNESEKTYRTLFEQSADAILIIEGDKFIDCNPATVKMLGYKSKKELLNTHPSELSPEMQPDGRSSFEKANEILSTFDQGSIRFKWDHKRQNGEVFPVEVVMTAIPIGERKVFHIVWRDITERTQADKKLRESEERFRYALDVTSDGVWDWNIKTGEVIFSDKWCRSLGYEPDGVVNNVNFWKAILHLDDIEETMNKLNEHFEGKTETYECENRLMKSSGEFRHNLDRGRVFEWDEHGKPLRMIGTDTDITERKKMEDELKHMATHDHLTGLYDRNVLEQQLNDEIQRASRYNHNLSVFMLDIDHFKTINDNYGHQIGDKILQHFAKELEFSIRNTDYPTRYGGEEFVVILPETPLPKAEELAERLRNQIAEHRFPIDNDEDINLTISIGIATFPENAQTGQELLEVADSAMYAAKEAGRNQVKTP